MLETLISVAFAMFIRDLMSFFIPELKNSWGMWVFITSLATFIAKKISWHD